MVQLWQDEFLAWDPAAYDGIDWLVLPLNSIWLPDTVLYNGLEMARGKSEHHINVELRMNPSSPDR